MRWRCWAAVDPGPLDGKAADAYALLALVAGQDVEPAEDSDGADGRRPEGRRGPDDLHRGPGHPARAQNPVPAGRIQGSHRGRATGLITAGELTKASGPENSDGAVGARLIGMDPTITNTSVDVLADSAYGSGEMLAALARTTHTPVIKAPAAPCRRRRVHPRGLHRR